MLFSQFSLLRSCCACAGITAVRLVNGSSPLSGRLEVQIDHSWWGTVSFRRAGGADLWLHCLLLRPTAVPPAATILQVCAYMDNVAARAACRGLGHPYGRVSSPWDAFGPGAGAVAISTVTCPAGAPSLNSCDYSLGSWDPTIPWTRAAPCGHGEDMSIECFDQPPGVCIGACAAAAALNLPHSRHLPSPSLPCLPAAHADPITGIRLANGTANSGRLEVQVASYGWGTVRVCAQRSSRQQSRAQLWEALTNPFLPGTLCAGLLGDFQQNGGRHCMPAAGLPCRRRPAAHIRVWAGQVS